MTAELIRLAPAEWPGLAHLIFDWNRRADGGVHCLHAQRGDDAASHAADLATLSADTAAFWALRDGTEPLAVVGCEFDPALQRAWVRGPLWAEPRAAELLLAMVGPALESALPSIRHFDAFPTLGSEPLNAWLAAAGYAPRLAYTVLRAPITEVPQEDRPTVRRAVQADIASVSALHRAMFPDGYLTEADLVRALEAADHALFVASGEDAEIAGYLYVQDAVAEQETYIDYLGVDPARRGRGLGRALLAAAARWGAAQGRAHVALTVSEDRPSAHALYRQSGFAEVSSARHWRKTVEPSG